MTSRALALLLLAALACSGGGPSGNGGPPRGTVLRNVVFCTADGVELRMDVHFPGDGADARAPAALFLHGGGWVQGARSGPEARWFDLVRPGLLARGFVVATADYRLSPEHRWPAHIEDAKCAVRALRARAGEWGIDPARIGVWGASAGGHLAALLGTTDPGTFEGTGGHAGVSSRVSAVVDLWGPADLTSAVGWPPGDLNILQQVFGTSDRGSPLIATASPTTHASAGDAPFLIIHGDADALVPLDQSQRLDAALDARGIPSELVVVAGGNHGLSNPGIVPTEAALVARIVDFLATRLD